MAPISLPGHLTPCSRLTHSRTRILLHSGPASCSLRRCAATLGCADSLLLTRRRQVTARTQSYEPYVHRHCTGDGSSVASDTTSQTQTDAADDAAQGGDVEVELGVEYTVKELCQLHVTQHYDNVDHMDKPKLSAAWTAAHMMLLWLYARRRIKAMEVIWDYYYETQQGTDQRLRELHEQICSRRSEGIFASVVTSLTRTHIEAMVVTLLGKEAIQIPPNAAGLENRQTETRSLISQLVKWAQDNPEIKAVTTPVRKSALLKVIHDTNISITPAGEDFQVKKSIRLHGTGVRAFVKQAFAEFDGGALHRLREGTMVLQELCTLLDTWTDDYLIYKRVSCDVHRHLPPDRPTSFTIRVGQMEPENKEQHGPSTTTPVVEDDASSGDGDDKEDPQCKAKWLFEYTGDPKALQHLVCGLQHYMCNECQTTDSLMHQWLPHGAVVQFRKEKKRGGGAAPPYGLRVLGGDYQWRETQLTDRQLWALVDAVDQFLKDSPGFMVLHKPTLLLGNSTNTYAFARAKSEVLRWLMRVALMLMLAVPLMLGLRRYVRKEVLHGLSAQPPATHIVAQSTPDQSTQHVQ